MARRLRARRALLQSLGAAAVALACGEARSSTPGLRARTLTGGETLLRDQDLRELGRSLHAPPLRSGNPLYEQRRRTWNRLFDHHPALIVRCQDARDVSAAINFARQHQLLTAVRSGGHSFAAWSGCEGGLVIDLGGMQRVRVDREARIVEVEPGALLGALDGATLADGLVTPCGSCPDVGVGGYVLGGGIGRLSRRFGLACDNLVSARIVTADGRERVASATEERDLYWALRGGGGNFGVVTALQLRLHPMQRRVLGGRIVWPAHQALEVLGAFAELAARAPDTLSLDASLEYSGDGTALVSVEVCATGDATLAEQQLQPLRRAAPSLVDTVGSMDYLQLQGRQRTANLPAQACFQKAGFMAPLSRSAVQALVAAFRGAASQRCTIVLQHMGGATQRVPDDAMAFPHREALHWVTVGAVETTATLAPERIAATRKAWSAIQPYTQGLYVNSIMDEAPREIRAAYGGHYARLARAKARHDPGNLFRLNANIAPEGGAARGVPAAPGRTGRTAPG